MVLGDGSLNKCGAVASDGCVSVNALCCNGLGFVSVLSFCSSQGIVLPLVGIRADGLFGIAIIVSFYCHVRFSRK